MDLLAHNIIGPASVLLFTAACGAASYWYLQPVKIYRRLREEILQEEGHPPSCCHTHKP